MAGKNLDKILKDAEYWYHPNIVADFRIYMAQYRLLCNELEAGRITVFNVDAYNCSLDFLEAEMYRLCPSVIPAGFPRVRKPSPSQPSFVTNPTSPNNWVRDAFLRAATGEKCIYCGSHIMEDGMCHGQHLHTALQTEEVVGCVGGIFCCCKEGWGHKSIWRCNDLFRTQNKGNATYQALMAHRAKYSAPCMSEIQPQAQYAGEAHYDFDVYKVVADLLGISRREAKMRILKKAFGVEGVCLHTCPKCGAQCNKKHGHAEAGYDGIGGLCWCEACKGWWMKGEKHLLHKRP